MSGKEETQNLELLLEVGRLLSSKLELNELLTTVMQLATRVVDSETASLLLVDEKKQELYFHVALGLDPELAKIRVKIGEGIAGTVARDAKPMIVNDVNKDARWTSKVDDESGFVTRSILAAPIVLKDRCIGVIEAINHKHGDFTFKELRIFEAFASQAAVAVENARLFASLQEEKTKLSTLVDEMHDAALLINDKGEIILSNGAASRLLGCKDLQLFTAAARGFVFDPPFGSIFSPEGKVAHFEAVREEPKKLVLAGTSSAIRDEKTGEIQGRVVVFRDITQEKHEEGLKRSFLSLISHKLKTPLSSITGYGQLVLEDLKTNKGSDMNIKFLGTVQTQAQKLASLVEKLLNYTVLEELDDAECTKAPFKVDDILKEAVDSMQSLLDEKKASAELKGPCGLSAVGDPILVRDAVKNLIENGVKFNEGEAKISVWAERQDGLVDIHVRDSGPGIPHEEHEKVFGKFYQIDDSFTGQIEGWGLGLTFVQKVTEKLGGSVRLESSANAGSTFTVSLPAAD